MSLRGISERAVETHTLEGLVILDAVRTDYLDSHQISVHQHLTSAGNPLYAGGGFKIGRVTVGDQVALRQKTTPGGNLLKPT